MYSKFNKLILTYKTYTVSCKIKDQMCFDKLSSSVVTCTIPPKKYIWFLCKYMQNTEIITYNVYKIKTSIIWIVHISLDHAQLMLV